MVTPGPVLPVPPDGTDDMRDLISEAIVINACSTFVELLAEVSKN